MIDKDQQWLNTVQAELEQSVQEIDAATQSKLTQIRYQALDKTPVKKRNLYGLPVAAMLSACLVLAIVVNLPEQQTDQNETMIDDLDLITNSESLELLEDLEFYEWLEDYDLPT